MERKERGHCPECEGVVVEKIYSKYEPLPKMGEPSFECLSCKRTFYKFPPSEEK